MKFIIETHLDTLDEELVVLLRKSGLITVKVGVESVDREVLQKSHRRAATVDRQESIIRMLESHGIGVICFYILGFPDDTWASCVSTINYAIRLNTAGAQFSICTPYPGTPFYEDVKDKITATRYDEFTQFNLVYKHQSLTYAQIEELKNMSYAKYYLRPSWIAKYFMFKFRSKFKL
jgi:radical SAM superfamily enzyme YgiQ (UPF0313 family)